MGVSRFPTPSPIQTPIPIGLYTFKEHQRILTFASVSEISVWGFTNVVCEKNIWKHKN